MENQELLEQLNWRVAEVIPEVGFDKKTIMELAEKHHWVTQVIAKRGMIDAPVITEKWRYEPLNLDECTIPEEGMARIDLILKSSYHPHHLIIGYEIKKEKSPKVNIPWRKVAMVVLAAMMAVIAMIAVALLILAVLVAAAAMITMVIAALTIVAEAIGSILMVLAAVAGLAMIDPKLICVTSEGEWITVFRYYE